jgi:hypothetical protein
MKRSIQEWKDFCEQMLPSVDAVVERNQQITSIYANLYWSNRELFKWAGMAAFASNHVGLGLLPFKWDGLEMLNLKTSCKKRSLLSDLNLVRHLNNLIFDDIAWVHFAYQEQGIQLLRELMKEHEKYQHMLEAWELLDSGKKLMSEKAIDEGVDRIWRANIDLLYHEQARVVQPVFNRLGGTFRRILTFCASLDFNPNHTKTDWRYHSSFVFYMYLYGKKIMMSTQSFPSLIVLQQRWYWLEKEIVENWKIVEKTDRQLETKFKKLIIHSNP